MSNLDTFKTYLTNNQNDEAINFLNNTYFQGDKTYQLKVKDFGGDHAHAKTGGTESLQVAIYATEEKRRRTGFDHVLVLARRGEALILRRDRINACWVLPEGQLARGQSAEEAARSALGEAVGEAVFDVYPLCAYGVTEENGKESGGFCYVADVREWPDEAADEARAFDRLPLSSQMDRPALILALHKWAGEWFDARITLERLGQPAPF